MTWPDDIDSIICGDALEIMAEMPDGCVDLVLCDLPYGVTQNSWDTPIDLLQLWILYERICKWSCVVVLTATQPFASRLVLNDSILFRYDWIWDKRRVSGFLNAHNRPLASHEHILVFCRDKPVYNIQWGAGEAYQDITRRGASNNYGKHERLPARYPVDRRFPQSILSVARPNDGNHPTEKPVGLFEYLIRTYSSKGDLVLDNCIGSGTTAVAAIKTGRHFVGIDISEEYCQLARERIEAERAQLTLF